MTSLKATEPQTFYGKGLILRDLGPKVNEGEIVTRVGRNGAGKTITLPGIMGLAAEVAAQAAYPGNAA